MACRLESESGVATSTAAATLGGASARAAASRRGVSGLVRQLSAPGGSETSGALAALWRLAWGVTSPDPGVSAPLEPSATLGGKLCARCQSGLSRLSSSCAKVLPDGMRSADKVWRESSCGVGSDGRELGGEALRGVRSLKVGVGVMTICWAEPLRGNEGLVIGGESDNVLATARSSVSLRAVPSSKSVGVVTPQQADALAARRARFGLPASNALGSRRKAPMVRRRRGRSGCTPTAHSACGRAACAPGH